MAELSRFRSYHILTLLYALVAVISIPQIWGHKWRYLFVGAILAGTLVCFVVESQWRKVFVLFAGMSDYHRRWPPARNAEVFDSVRSEFCYCGISFTTLLKPFKTWFENPRPASSRCRLLLVDPEATDVLRFQVCFERGWDESDLSADQEQEVEQAVAGVQNGIRFALATLRGLKGSKEFLEIRLHRERLTTWTYRVDGKSLYLGILRRGEDGLQGPLVVWSKRGDEWSMFDYYSDLWDGLWHSCAGAPTI